MNSELIQAILDMLQLILVGFSIYLFTLFFLL